MGAWQRRRRQSSCNRLGKNNFRSQFSFMSRKYFTVKILYEYWQPSAVGGFEPATPKWACASFAESGRGAV